MKTKISSFLKERPERFKPAEANKLNLKRLQKIDFSGKMHFLENKKTNTNMILIKSGDLVISGINIEKGAVAVYQGEEDISATIHYSSYEFDKNKINVEYFKWFLKSKTFKDIVNSQIGGGIKTELKPKKFLPLEIPFLSLPEQKQILKKINSMKNEINDVEQNVSYDKTLLSKLRQAILSEAVQGKLVPQNPDDEPATELLKKIKAEKEKLIKDRKIKKGEELPTITEDEIPYELPNGWVWTRLGEVCILRRGASPRPIKKYVTESEEGINWIKIGDTSKGSKYLTETKEKITPEGAKKSVFVTKGELIMSNSMSFGEPYILKINGCIHDGWLSFNYPKQFVNIDFLYYLLLSQKIYYESKAEGTGVRNLNINKVFQMPIPLPPLSEQRRIVEKVDALMKFCDELELRIGENKQSSERLMGAVLRESFEE